MLEIINLPSRTHFVQAKVDFMEESEKNTNRIIHCIRVYSQPEGKWQVASVIVCRIWEMFLSLLDCSTWQLARKVFEDHIFKNIPRESRSVMSDSVRDMADDWIRKLINLNNSKKEFSEEQLKTYLNLGRAALDNLSHGFNTMIELTPKETKQEDNQKPTGIEITEITLVDEKTNVTDKKTKVTDEKTPVINKKVIGNKKNKKKKTENVIDNNFITPSKPKKRKADSSLDELIRMYSQSPKSPLLRSEEEVKNNDLVNSVIEEECSTSQDEETDNTKFYTPNPKNFE